MYRFRTVLYYIKKNLIKLILIIKFNIEFIMFFNKGIFVIELKY